MTNAERERAIVCLEYYGEKLGCKAEFDLAIKALHTVEIIEEELGPAYEEMAIWFDVPHFEEIQERAEKRANKRGEKNE